MLDGQVIPDQRWIDGLGPAVAQEQVRVQRKLWAVGAVVALGALLGFLLMLGATGATLVAPYLTMPLMDRVLIPFQNGQAIDATLVALMLGGLFGAALLTLTNTSEVETAVASTVPRFSKISKASSRRLPLWILFRVVVTDRIFLVQ